MKQLTDQDAQVVLLVTMDLYSLFIEYQFISSYLINLVGELVIFLSGQYLIIDFYKNYSTNKIMIKN